MTEKVYTRVKDAEIIVKKLCEKQPDVLWCVKPDMVAVLGIENKERSEKNKVLAKIKPFKGCEKAILMENNIPVRYVIELYWSDWNDWNQKKRQWIIFHELLHIHSEIGKTVKHDCEDFKIILDKVGVNWTTSDNLPNLIEDNVKFDLGLRPNLEESENDEIEDNKEKEEDEKQIEVAKDDEEKDDKEIF